MDSLPFSKLPAILADYDDRVWLFAELIGEEFTAKHAGAWAPAYHGMQGISSQSVYCIRLTRNHNYYCNTGYLWYSGLLYNVTDEAISACPPSSEWVLVTNGDNLYADTFFDRIMSVPREADAIAFDFYSRYQRITGPPCMRFSEGLTACKTNRRALLKARMCFALTCLALWTITFASTCEDNQFGMSVWFVQDALVPYRSRSKCL